jgi:hypothetical protein
MVSCPFHLKIDKIKLDIFLLGGHFEFGRNPMPILIQKKIERGSVSGRQENIYIFP